MQHLTSVNHLEAADDDRDVDLDADLDDDFDDDWDEDFEDEEVGDNELDDAPFVPTVLQRRRPS